MSAQQDRVAILGFWTRQAEIALPHLAWAIGEISKNATLDELCVELEVISGQSAYQTRTVILQTLADGTVGPFRQPTPIIVHLSRGSARLAIWCLLAGFDAGPDKNLTLAAAGALDVLRGWCYGRVNNEVLAREFEMFAMMSRGSPDPPQGITNILLRIMRLAEMSERENLEDHEYQIRVLTDALSRYIGLYLQSESNKILIASMHSAILVFPVLVTAESR